MITVVERATPSVPQPGQRHVLVGQWAAQPNRERPVSFTCPSTVSSQGFSPYILLLPLTSLELTLRRQSSREHRECPAVEGGWPLLKHPWHALELLAAGSSLETLSLFCIAAHLSWLRLWGNRVSSGPDPRGNDLSHLPQCHQEGLAT